MVGFDDALGGHRPPQAGEIEVTFAPRRLPKPAEPKASEPALPAVEPSAEEAGELGGASTSGAGGSGSGGAAAASGAAGTGAEQITQRDDPDEGEHTDSTEEQLAARAEAEAAKAEAEGAVVEAEVAPEVAPEPEAAVEQAPESEKPAEKPARAKKPAPATNIREELARFPGTQPVVYEKTGFSAGDVDTVLVKRFPAPLVDRLRLSLAPSVGGTFAEQLSAPALIAAFLIAKTGMELEVDANTAVAVDVFRQVDPRLLAVEQRLDEVLGNLEAVAETGAKTLEKAREIGAVADRLENSTAYLVGDRVTRLSTQDVNETNVDVTQKKVLVVRDRIREKTKEQQRLEQEREGREIHRSGGTSGDWKRS